MLMNSGRTVHIGYWAVGLAVAISLLIAGIQMSSAQELWNGEPGVLHISPAPGWASMVTLEDGSVILFRGRDTMVSHDGGRTWQDGFAVKGPRIEQSLALAAGEPVTTIRTNGYLFTDADGVGVTMRALGQDHLRNNVDGAGPRVTVRPTDVTSSWDVAATRAFKLDSEGTRIGEAACSPAGDDRIALGPFTETTLLDLHWGTPY